VPQWSLCYSLTNTVPDSLRSAAEYAILTSRFVPATHAGRPVAVHLVLMVMVDTTLDAPLVLAVRTTESTEPGMACSTVLRNAMAKAISLVFPLRHSRHRAEPGRG
jgi:hypothetical protein